MAKQKTTSCLDPDLLAATKAVARNEPGDQVRGRLELPELTQGLYRVGQGARDSSCYEVGATDLWLPPA